ncbi:MAG TPA: hypothetical protein PK694_04035 [Rhodospirillales bacterium]|nr:hypothetical protein [Rhodospirillales bacterium]
MPEMDGNEVILWLAGHRCTARLIIMTGCIPPGIRRPWRPEPVRFPTPPAP